MKLSIVLPIYNESESLSELFDEVRLALSAYDYEVIAVNDGSIDATEQRLQEITSSYSQLKIINFKKNYGQTAALNAGIKNTTGDVVILMDSDLENSPSDIPILLAKLTEGYDVVSGWRKSRWKGQFLTRKLPSLLANKLISAVSGVKLHDYGCTLKVYKKEVISGVKLYGQMHRFIPVYCKWQGGKVTEVPVSYQPRKYGKSNYGISRTYKVLLDLIVIKFLEKYMQKPIHFFGGVGFGCFLISIISFLIAFYFKVTGQKDFVETPLPVVTAMFFIVGVLMILMGVLAEIQMRTYYESQNLDTYKIKNKMNF